MGSLIVKLHFPLWREDYEVERIVLSHLSGLPTSQIVALGEIEGGPYLVMSAVNGLPAVKVWRRLHYAYGDPDLSVALIKAYGLDVTDAVTDVLILLASRVRQIARLP